MNQIFSISHFFVVVVVAVDKEKEKQNSELKTKLLLMHFSKNVQKLWKDFIA